MSEFGQLKDLSVRDLVIVILVLVLLRIIGPLLLKIWPTKKDGAESDSIYVTTASKVVELVRVQLEEGTKQLERSSELIGKQDNQIEELKRRVDKLEERERHSLMRAATHEAWDTMVFQRLYSIDPTISPPPPLLGEAAHMLKELEDGERPDPPGSSKSRPEEAF